MKIDIISNEFIKPSSPTPAHLRTYTLSLFDQICAPSSYVPLVIFYSPEGSRFNQTEACHHLKRSLSDALTQFYPLAGRMIGESWVHHIAGKLPNFPTESSVDCKDDGVRYVEAQVDTHLEDIILSTEAHVLDKLIPYNLGDKNLKVEEQLGIQVNLFNCGGIAIGICFSHRLADGFSISTFIRHWAATSRGDIANLIAPSFIAASLFPPREQLLYKPIASIPGEGLLTRKLHFDASTIAVLKSEVMISNSGVVDPTRVEVVTAVIWKHAIGQISNSSRSIAFHPVNVRRMVPELNDHCFGNVFLMANAVFSNESADLSTLVAKLRTAIRKVDHEYVRERQGEDGYEVHMENFKKIRNLVSDGEVQLLRFSSWCGFPVYECDFGFGNPRWVSSTSMFTRNSVLLMDSKSDGGIEAWVTLLEQDVTILQQLETLLTSFASS